MSLRMSRRFRFAVNLTCLFIILLKTLPRILLYIHSGVITYNLKHDKYNDIHKVIYNLIAYDKYN